MKEYGLGNTNSFFLALIVYVCVIIFVFFKLVTQIQRGIEYTDIKDSFIDIEFIQIPKEFVEQNIAHPIEKAPQEIDIQELFAQTTNKAVKTEHIDQKASNFNELFGSITQIQEEKTTKVQSSAKSQNVNSPKIQALDLVKHLNDNLIQQESITQSQSIQGQKIGVYDEFLGRITRIITQRWKQYYPNDEKISVEVRIFIDENGNFGYTSVQKSGNFLYDAKVAQFLENQRGKFISYPPENQSVNIIMNLKDELQIEEFRREK